MYIGCPIHSTVASNMDTATAAPTPVTPRRTSADSTEVSAYMPAAMSEVGMPVLATSSALPVIEISPASAWTSMS